MSYRWEAIIALVIGVMWQIVAIIVIKNGGDGMLQVIAGALFMILGEIRLHRRW